MTPQQFIAKWQRAQLTERSACQQHFLDLCALLGQPTPAEADPDGDRYTFERGVAKSTGGQGFADVWMRDHFGWEYKGKHKDLAAAYDQLLLYREALENPPLLVVCDMDRFEVHTNFTGTKKRVFAFDLAGLADPENLDVLRRLFTDPASLRPGLTSQAVTEQAAAQFGLLADGMRLRGVPAERAAHFLMRLMFAMFAEDVGLLPAKVFTRLVDSSKRDPDTLARRLRSLFASMAKGGDFGAELIPWFNGGLFADDDTVELTPAEIEALTAVNLYDWAYVEPSIFGTLFERTLDPGKRAQIGAHYTGRQDIETLLEPVLMAPLRREWQHLRRRCDEELWPKVAAAKTKAAGTKAHNALHVALREFTERLAHLRVLDPACGSGNFLYVALHLLLGLEKEVIAYAAAREVGLTPLVKPTQLAGLEINPYAQQLAQVVVWIGYLQWMHHNGFTPPSHPVLAPIETIRRMDAIVDLGDAAHPREPEWPAADVIVGNPPFLGGKLLRANLGDEYVDAMFRVWDGRVPREADLCCYWFEKARAGLVAGRVGRAGLLATQGIRGGANRKVLQQVKESGDIFFAESDREWILDGANVHVSMVGFDRGEETERRLDGATVPAIAANLSGRAADVTTAKRLKANADLGFMGDTKGGGFDIPEAVALAMLCRPNPHGRPNSDVVFPWINGLDITRRPRAMWIIDFGVERTEAEAACYEAPFGYLDEHVRPERMKNKRDSYRQKWWLHVEPRPAMRDHFKTTYLATARVAKHRLFEFFPAVVLPDSALIVFARDDDAFFGVLHSRAHEVWALKLGTQLETRPRYTPTSCFETFPLPEPSPEQAAAIAAAAKELDELRSRWLNPPEWTRTETLAFPGAVDGPWGPFVVDADARGIGTVRWPRLVPVDAEAAKELGKRTLTNLYNKPPAWLTHAHRRLDAAVFAAYGWPADLADDDLLGRLLSLNHARAAER